MSHLLINGVELDLALSPETKFQEVIQFLRKSYNTDTALISSVRVNGSEMTEPEEARLALTPISELDSIEVFTAHPKEIVQETLQDLFQFVVFLQDLSKETSGLTQDQAFFPKLAQLIDGISTLTEAITHSKRVLKIGILTSVNVLEADLLSILKDLLESQQKNDLEYVAELLREHLPANLEQWRSVGIPALIRARDS